MSFLLADSEYASSSEGESDAEGGGSAAQVTLRAPEREESARKTPAELLPSAESALSSASAATASFLPPKHSVGGVQPVAESFDLLAKQDAQRRKQTQDARQRRSEPRRAPTEATRKRPAPESPPTTRQTPTPTPAAKRDKVEAKERVKAQRTRGQAGIGSDFRAWKSETEMAMRQQFD